MNEQVQTWLLKTLESLTSAAEKAADFAAGELPLFVQEFLTFYTIWSWTMVVALLALSIGLLVFSWKWHQKIQKDRWDEIAYLPLTLALVFGGSPLIISLFVELKTAMLVTFAPRVFLLTEFIKFFK